MTKLDAALLKLEGALDYTTDPRIRSLIDVAQQAIETAKLLMSEMPKEAGEFVPHQSPTLECGVIACVGGYQRAA